jgi:simple sugar transport system ATP-binding protein
LEVGEQLGWRLDPRARVADLPVGVQQRIEILKCLAADAPVLIFDEPTAVLSQAEVADLFRVLRDLKAQGKTLILIAHKLAEVMSIADRLTVLRRGKLVAEASITDVTADQLAHWMVGDLPSPGPKGNRKKFDGALNASEVIVRGSRGETAIDRVSFEIKRGEVLGFGGVDGNGQLELAEALVGVRRYSGEIRPRMAQIAYIPQDRQADGLALRMTIEENLLIAGHRRRDLVRHGFLNGKAIRAWSRHLMDKFDIRASSPLQLAEALSGGNQQKVVVSRELDSTPDLLVAVNPTRGLDIQATRFVHQVIRETRDAGTPVALFSADLDELAELADETVFMSRGKLIRGDDAAAVVGGIA